MPAFESVFEQIAAILALAALFGGVSLVLRQPPIVSFIALGVVLGPSVLGWTAADDEVHLLAQVGVSVLLFLVGLDLDLALVKRTGPVAVATGLGQVVFTSAFGYLLALAFGLTPIPALYVAVALTFSSTIIIVKLLSDKRELEALHGRIAVGFLIVQDLLVILVMVALTALANPSGGPDLAAFALGSLAFLLGVLVSARWLLPPLVRALSRSSELLVFLALAWAVLLSVVAERIGLSREIGAFLGGVSLASSPFRDAIGARLVGIRDFLLLFFFIDLGALIDLSALGPDLGAALTLSAFVLIGNPLIVILIMGAMGYRSRVSFLAGLTVAQISEFSLILVTLGAQLGHVDRDVVGLVTAVGLVTIALSSYLILYSHPLYERLAPLLRVFERAPTSRSPREPATGPKPEVLVFGLGRYGGRIADGLARLGRTVVGFDHDPAAVDRAQARGLSARYADVADPHLMEHLPLAEARVVVCALPEPLAARRLVTELRRQGFRGLVVARVDATGACEQLQAAGVDRFLEPFEAAADVAIAELAELSAA